jgi:hypothetical protein
MIENEYYLTFRSDLMESGGERMEVKVVVGVVRIVGFHEAQRSNYSTTTTRGVTCRNLSFVTVGGYVCQHDVRSKVLPPFAKKSSFTQIYIYVGPQIGMKTIPILGVPDLEINSGSPRIGMGIPVPIWGPRFECRSNLGTKP